MSESDFPFQPGAVLHDAVVGAFRARGYGFDAWCASQGISTATARGATFGQSKGPKGRALLARLIEAAGPDVVRAAYVARMQAHVAAIQKGAA